MTSAVEPEYIRCVSVASQRCPSGVSVRSTLSVLPVSIQRNRPKTAADVVTSARGQAERILDTDRTDMLDELMFLYGRGVSNSFAFTPRPGSGNSYLSRSRTTLCMSPAPVSPWEVQSSASLQMFRASSKYQRRRPFPQPFSQPLVQQKIT